MIWLYYILLILIAMCALALVVVTLPGLWVMTATAAIYALLTHERHIGFKSLAALFVLSLSAEILEMTAGGAAARKAGGERRAAVGALLGGIAGGIIGSLVFPLVLTIVGVCLGSFVGAAGFEFLGGGATAHSLGVGWAAAKGRFLGVMMKLVVGIVMFLLVVIAAFP
ncbi:MAG: DUF456 family protein [Tepidisphaeraceae bacterium]|jgi:hypothetical protein